MRRKEFLTFRRCKRTAELLLELLAYLARNQRALYARLLRAHSSRFAKRTAKESTDKSTCCQATDDHGRHSASTRSSQATSPSQAGTTNTRRSCSSGAAS